MEKLKSLIRHKGDCLKDIDLTCTDCPVEQACENAMSHPFRNPLAKLKMTRVENACLEAAQDKLIYLICKEK